MMWDHKKESLEFRCKSAIKKLEGEIDRLKWALDYCIGRLYEDSKLPFTEEQHRSEFYFGLFEKYTNRSDKDLKAEQEEKE
jgi:hypothetical protein